MTNKEIYKEYIEGHCKECKNKDKNLCEIRKCKTNEEVKCVYYEREY